MIRFAALTEFSMTFHVNRFMSRAHNAKQFLFAMRHDFANDDKLVFRIKLNLKRFPKFSLTRSNFLEIREMFYTFFFKLIEKFSKNNNR